MTHLRLARFLRTFAILPLLLALSSCYIPDKFKAELRLSRFGDYALTFDGDLLYVPLLHDYEAGNVKPEQEAERLDNVRADLVRDQAVKSAISQGRGRFAVHYERSGYLGRNQLSAILRRDARILMLKSKPDNQIIIAANGIRPTDAQALSRAGITLQGEFRVTTDANIVRHNATEVRQFGAFKVYIWKIENALSPMPKLVMIRDIDPTRPPQ